MKVGKITRLCWILVLLAGCIVVGRAFAADDRWADTTNPSQEMPVLTGVTWQTLPADTKIAFIWGVGHVVTIEEHVIQRHPEMQRQDFVAKLADGLRGVPMSSIIETVDNYYRRYPEDLDLPVMRVIWSQIVRPKVKSGIADRPFDKEDND